MPKKISLRLWCCGADHTLMINEEAFRRGDPNEIRRNVICSACNRLVVLEFKDEDGTTIEQEVVDLDS